MCTCVCVYVYIYIIQIPRTQTHNLQQQVKASHGLESELKEARQRAEHLLEELHGIVLCVHVCAFVIFLIQLNPRALKRYGNAHNTF